MYITNRVIVAALWQQFKLFLTGVVWLFGVF